MPSKMPSKMTSKKSKVELWLAPLLAHAVLALRKLPRLAGFLPLATAVLTLLLGLLPLARVPHVEPYTVAVNAYQLPLAQLLQFLIFPLAMLAVWAMTRWVKGFAAMANWLLLGAAALQVVSLFLLSTQAGEALRTLLRNDLKVADPDALPQRLAIGFWLLLAMTVACIAFVGYQVVQGIAVARRPQRSRERQHKKQQTA
jgi:hypothetical protein